VGSDGKPLTDKLQPRQQGIKFLTANRRETSGARSLEVGRDDVEEVHAELESDETSRIGRHSSAHDRNEAFVESSRAFVLDERPKDVLQASRIFSLRRCLQSALQHILRHSDRPISDSSCKQNQSVGLLLLIGQLTHSTSQNSSSELSRLRGRLIFGR
jgi:hypothetical protein